MNKKFYYSGFVKIIGRTNVGKSSLMNCLVGKKISITSKKHNTTNNPITGIYTRKNYQIVFIDTPGVLNSKHNNSNRLLIPYVNKKELIILVVESNKLFKYEKEIINKLNKLGCLIILVINKIDLLHKKDQLLNYISYLNKEMNIDYIFPFCTKNSNNINELINVICKFLPKHTHFFPKNFTTNQSSKFIISEIIREKLMRFTGDEIPYISSVKILDFYLNRRKEYNIYVLIMVQKISQKKILIGSNGEKIKMISMKSRKDIKNFLKTKTHLKLWVKTK